MKLAIVCAVFKRPELTSIVLNHYNRLKQEEGFDLQLIAVGSEGQASRTICEEAGWHYIEHPNVPLSQKINRLFEEAKKYDVDGVIWIGSDTLMSKLLLDYYDLNFSDKEEYVQGITDLYFYDIPRDESLYFKYIHTTEIIGTGRFFSKKILDKVNWRICGDAVINRGVDSHASRYLKRLGIGENGISMEHAQGVCVEIKSDVVMTQYEMLFDEHCTKIDGGKYRVEFDKKTIKDITDLKPIMSDKIYVTWQELKNKNHA